MVVNDLDPLAVRRACEELTALGLRCAEAVFDVADSHQVDAAFDTIRAELGPVEVLVNNAGLLRLPPGFPARNAAWRQARDEGRPWGSLGSTVAISDEDWRLHMSVLLDGTFYCTRAALLQMEAAGAGAIVNIASMGAFQRSAPAPHYAAAKAGVVAFTRAVGMDVAGAGIRVNAVAPGTFDTEIAGRLPPGKRSPLADGVPIGRLGDPAELAAVVAFLASDEASYCFGEIYTVSGGA